MVGCCWRGVWEATRSLRTGESLGMQKGHSLSLCEWSTLPPLFATAAEDPFGFLTWSEPRCQRNTRAIALFQSFHQVGKGLLKLELELPLPFCRLFGCLSWLSVSRHPSQSLSDRHNSVSC